MYRAVRHPPPPKYEFTSTMLLDWDVPDLMTARSNERAPDLYRPEPDSKSTSVTVAPDGNLPERSNRYQTHR